MERSHVGGTQVNKRERKLFMSSESLMRINLNGTLWRHNERLVARGYKYIID